jgi:hypothetical protein
MTSCLRIAPLCLASLNVGRSASRSQRSHACAPTACSNVNSCASSLSSVPPLSPMENDPVAPAARHTARARQSALVQPSLGHDASPGGASSCRRRRRRMLRLVIAENHQAVRKHREIAVPKPGCAAVYESGPFGPLEPETGLFDMLTKRGS